MKSLEMLDCQIQGLSYSLENPYCILALDPGLGKSRVAIELREICRPRQQNCLIVCPGYLVQNWEDEINKWTENKIITKIQSGKEIYDLIDSDYAIVSYELAQKAEQFFEWADIVVLDEAHYIKGMEAKRTQFIHKNIFENSIPRVILLTGTPIKNHVNEFYSLLTLTFYDPNTPDVRFLDKYPTSIDFADQFSHRFDYELKVGARRIQLTKWNGIKNTKELKTWLENRYLRIRAVDALDLPPITFKEVLISKTPDKKLIEAFDKFVERGSEGAGSEAKKLSAIEKVPFTIKHVESLLQQSEDCVAVYSDHVDSCEAIAKKFGVLALTGKVQAGKRVAYAKRWQAGGEGRVLCATIGALSTGVTLTRSNRMVLNDLPWVPGDLEQVMRRIQRLGQLKPCFVDLIFGSPQDKKIYSALKEKQKIIDKAT